MPARIAQGASASDTAANFRSFCQAIHDALAFAGLVQTADTGQINLATVSNPGATETFMGYEVWRFADALQATAPVFMRIDYGGGDAATYPAIKVAVGTGTNGAGTLTGKVTSTVELYARNNGNAVAPLNKDFIVSGDTNRIALLMCRAPASTAFNMFFSVERTKDANGADTNEGILFEAFNRLGNSSAVFAHSALIFGVGSAQPTRIGAGGDGHRVCAVDTSQTNCNDGTNVGVFPHSIPGKRGSEQPGMNALSYFRTDFAADSVVTVNIYGADHSYKCLGSDAVGNGISSADANAYNEMMLAMRYE